MLIQKVVINRLKRTAWKICNVKVLFSSHNLQSKAKIYRRLEVPVVMKTVPSRKNIWILGSYPTKLECLAYTDSECKRTETYQHTYLFFSFKMSTIYYNFLKRQTPVLLCFIRMCITFCLTCSTKRKMSLFLLLFKLHVWILSPQIK